MCHIGWAGGRRFAELLCWSHVGVLERYERSCGVNGGLSVAHDAIVVWFRQMPLAL